MLKWLKKLWPTNGQASSLRDEEEAVDYTALFEELDALRIKLKGGYERRLRWFFYMQPDRDIPELNKMFKTVDRVFEKHGVELDANFKMRMLLAPPGKFTSFNYKDVWIERLKYADQTRGGL